MDGYEYQENHDREIFQRICDDRGFKVEFSKGRFDSYDGIIITDTGERVMFELKERTKFVYDSVMLETVKMKGLKSCAKDLGITKIAFINFLHIGDKKDMWIYVFDDRLEALEEKEWLCRKTCVEDKGRVMKKLRCIPLDFGKSYNINKYYENSVVFSDDSID